MIDLCSPPTPAVRVASLYLDYGADAQECSGDDVEICELGMQVRSRWRFEMGTQLSLAFVCGNGLAAGQRFTVEVTVVSCEPSVKCPGSFRSTLMFTEMPEELRRVLRGGVAA